MHKNLSADGTPAEGEAVGVVVSHGQVLVKEGDAWYPLPYLREMARLGEPLFFRDDQWDAYVTESGYMPAGDVPDEDPLEREMWQQYVERMVTA